MTMDQHRRPNSLRYREYDYTQAGGVFLTFCTHHRQHLFGTIIDGQMVHSPAGALACERWMAIPGRFSGVAIDEFVVMPDHVHGIVWTGLATPVSKTRTTPGDVIRWFKSSVHAGYRDGVNQAHWPPTIVISGNVTTTTTSCATTRTLSGSAITLRPIPRAGTRGYKPSGEWATLVTPISRRQEQRNRRGTQGTIIMVHI